MMGPGHWGMIANRKSQISNIRFAICNYQFAIADRSLLPRQSPEGPPRPAAQVPGGAKRDQNVTPPYSRLYSPLPVLGVVGGAGNEGTVAGEGGGGTVTGEDGV
jgi:hypothetical protein